MTLYATAAVLAVLATVLLGPLSIALAKATWVDRAPRAAVALWQAVGVSALVAGLVVWKLTLEVGLGTPP